MRKVGACDIHVIELDLHPSHFLMRQSQKLIEHPQLAHQLQRGRMDGVAAKIAEEITVLFEHDHLNAGSREQQPEHHSSRAAAGDTTGSSDLLRLTLRLTHRETSTDKHPSIAS